MALSLNSNCFYWLNKVTLVQNGLIYILPYTVSKPPLIQDAIYSFSRPIVVFLPLLSAEHLGHLGCRVLRCKDQLPHTCWERQLYSITPWQEREFEKEENFSFLLFEMTVDLHTVIVIGEDLARWFPLTPWIPFASSPATFCLSSPWLSPLWAPAFCLLGVRSLGSPLALWWYKHWHNHMFSCGVGIMLKFFLLFQNIPFLPSPLLWETNLSWAVSCCLPWFLLLFQLPFQNIWSTKEVYAVHYHVKALTNLPSFLYPSVILCSFYT